MKCNNFLLLLIISITGLLQFGGCSLVGLGIGAIVDSGTEPENHKISDQEFNNIEPGDSLTITLKSGEVITGEFKSFSDMNMKDYTELYNKSRENIFLPFPNIEDTIAINTGFSNVYSFDYIFLGFDFGAVRVRELDNLKLENYSLDDVKFIVFKSDKNNRVIQKDILNNFLSAGRLPVISNVKIRNESGVSDVNGNEIINAVFVPYSNAWLTGLVIGGVVDFAIAMKLMVDGLGIRFPRH